MKPTIIIASATLALASLTAEAITPRWLRDVQIAPDGRTIAFTYKGDIYTVAVGGGRATRLTAQPSYESQPVWSPDGRKIAFASDRNYGSDIYIMDAQGGTATRLTSHSANEYPQGFTPDGQRVLFSANIQDPAESALFPNRTNTELYSVGVDGGRVSQVLPTPALAISYLPDGRSFLYEDVKGSEDQWRKHHTSSVTRDIWLYDATAGTHTNLTNRDREYRNPVMGRDGTTVYLLSEHDGGSFNVYSFPLSAPGQMTKLTNFTTHPVRFLSQATDGLLAFTYDGDIYTMKPGGEPQKVAIDVLLDEADPTTSVTLSSVTDAAPSADGKQLAFTSRGEVFVSSIDYSSVKQVTHTPEGESDVSWGKDNRELYYTSERDGHYNIYRAWIERSDDPNFSNATLINEEAVFPVTDTVDRTFPRLSPDGTKLAYVEDRTRLMVKDLKTGTEKQLTDGSTKYSREKGFPAQWSPDSKWILLEVVDLKHQPYSDIAIINVDNGQMTYVTKTGYFDSNPHWVMDGNAILFLSERYGMRNHSSWGSEYDAMLTFLNQDSYDRYRLSEEDYELLKDLEKSQKKASKKKKKTTTTTASKSKTSKANDKESEEADSTATDGDQKMKPIELEGLADRTVRLTPNSSLMGDAILSKDGETLYYTSKFEKDYDLWEHDLRKRETKRVTKVKDGTMTMDNEGNIYIIDKKVKRFTPKGNKVKDVDLSAVLRYDPAKEREYMLHHVYNEERERFYVVDMNGVAWEDLYNHYREFLPHINNNYDFAELLSELLGELNVSHTGGRYYPYSAKEPTASLGLLFDWDYEGPGLKVSEVVEKGPFDRATTDMKAGMVIDKINDQEIGSVDDYYPLLNNLAGKKTLITFRNPLNGLCYYEVVLPISDGAFTDLLYDRWVKQREADVDRLSGGRLGYVHIKAMNDDSFRPIYSKILGQYVDREGIVIDTRWNGGGRLHEDIEVMFSAKPYLTQDVHGVETSVMPSRRWTKPSIMVMGEANYSNAHGTPWVYKHMGLGKLVGMPVPGTMSSVNWEWLQDPTLLFGIPVTGFRTEEGIYLENTQLEPDIRVANNPATIATGRDSQLEAAVNELLREIDSKK
ncbi:MAG: peptidase S41 [Bacteroidales bacterium]|nr:peptidase S41 [Bacteroidales bacterium]